MPIIGSLKIQNGKVTYRDKAKNPDHHGQLSRPCESRALAETATDSLTIDGQGTRIATPPLRSTSKAVR